MDLVDEQHVARLEVGEQCRKIAGAGDHRPRGHAKADAELGGDDLGERGLAEPGRAREQRVIKRLLAMPGRLDEHPKIGAQLRLTDELTQPLRPQRHIRIIARRLRTNESSVAGVAS